MIAGDLVVAVGGEHERGRRGDAAAETRSTSSVASSAQCTSSRTSTAGSRSSSSSDSATWRGCAAPRCRRERAAGLPATSRSGRAAPA